MNLSEQLKKWRGVKARPGKGKVQGAFSQAEAAERLGVPLKTYISWEQGLRAPRGLALQVVKERIGAK